jgi:hypothetical protein
MHTPQDLSHAIYFSSIALDFGRKRSTIPDVILNDLAQVDFSTIKLEWIFHQYHLTFHCKIGDVTGEAVFIFEGKDYTLTRGWMNGEHKEHVDFTKRYPDAFKSTALTKK